MGYAVNFFIALSMISSLVGGLFSNDEEENPLSRVMTDVQFTDAGLGAMSRDRQVDFIDANLSRIRNLCDSQRNVVEDMDGEVILCYHGFIGATDELDEYARDYSIVYMNSDGGDILTAFKLGQEIFRNKAYVIVDRGCHSACGGYVIPSSRKLYIADNTVISIHSTIPRTRLGFVSTRFEGRMSEFRAEMQNGSLSSQSTIELVGLLRQYDEFYENFILRELEFFRAVNKDTAFVLRHREVYRSLRRRSNYSCKPESGLHLVIGPQYLDEFGIKTVREWYPSNKVNLIPLLGDISETDALIYDFDDHPFWMPERGLVSPQECSESG